MRFLLDLRILGDARMILQWLFMNNDKENVMRKMLLASLLGLVSSLSAAAQSDWNGGFSIESHGQYFEVAHVNDTHEVCVAAGYGHFVTNLDDAAFLMCSHNSINFHINVNNWKVTNPEGLLLNYDMSKEQFKDAFARADVRYVG